MTTLPENVRRLALILGSVLVASPLVTVLTSAARAVPAELGHRVIGPCKIVVTRIA